MTRRAFIEPPQPRDLTPITLEEFEVMVSTLGEEADISPDAKLAIASEWLFLRCLDIDDASDQHIVAALGVTKQAIHQAKTRALHKCRRGYEEGAAKKWIPRHGEERALQKKQPTTDAQKSRARDIAESERTDRFFERRDRQVDKTNGAPRNRFGVFTSKKGTR